MLGVPLRRCTTNILCSRVCCTWAHMTLGGAGSWLLPLSMGLSGQQTRWSREMTETDAARLGHLCLCWVEGGSWGGLLLRCVLRSGFWRGSVASLRPPHRYTQPLRPGSFPLEGAIREGHGPGQGTEGCSCGIGGEHKLPLHILPLHAADGPDGLNAALPGGSGCCVSARPGSAGAAAGP